MKRASKHLWWTIAAVLLCATLATVVTITALASTRTQTFQKVNITLTDNIDLSFWADIDEATAKKADTYVTFNDGEHITYSHMATSSGVKYAVYTCRDILPQNIADAVTAKLYVGGALVHTKDFSVKQYAQKQLQQSDDAALKTLVSDMLVYGAKAQLYLGEEDTILDGIDGLAARPAPTTMHSLTTFERLDDLASTPSANIKEGGLVLQSSVLMYVDIGLTGDADASDLHARLTINGRQMTTSLVRLSENNYRATFNNIPVAEFFEEVRIGVYDSESRISKNIVYSVADYLKTVASDAQASATLKELVKALYNYGISAHVYRGEHIVKMPGTLQAAGKGSSSKDDYGTLSYVFALCEHDMGAITASHIRTFDAPHTNGSISNNGIFTQSHPTDSDGNKFLRLLRGNNTATNALGYYFSIAQSQKIPSGTYMPSDRYTFDFDIRSPEGGMASSSINLRNGQFPSEGRWGSLLNMAVDGSISSGGGEILAPAGTINPNTWTHITMTLDFCEVAGAPIVYVEYYINGTYISEYRMVNSMGDMSFTELHMALNPGTATAEQGMEYDNFVFAQDCVHPFTGTVEEYLQQKETNDLQHIIDLIKTEFALSDFQTVVRAKAQNGTYVTYTETKTELTDMVEAAAQQGRSFELPKVAPKAGQHPRMLFTSEDIPGILAAIDNAENDTAVKQFLTRAAGSTDGKLTPTDPNGGSASGNYNYNGNVLGIIEAKALYYALYKDSTDEKHADALMRGYQAIYAMKNYLLTLDVQWTFTDHCRMYGHTMFVTSLVYDWCYDLLSESDKEQFMFGVENLLCDGNANAPDKGTHHGLKMEMGFPPQTSIRQTPITGHGAEDQLLRDYTSFAIAIYDEKPDWWNYIGGVLYEEYVPVRNYFYEGHYYPDGSSGYNSYRFFADIWNAWLFKGMGVELPYNEENMRQTIHALFSVETYNGAAFPSGDGTSNASVSGTPSLIALVGSYLFDDEVLRAQFKHFSNNYTKGFGYNQSSITAAEFLILSGTGVKAAANRQAEAKRLTYSAGFQQQIVSRTGFGSNAAIVLLQGAQRLPGGHTHQNAGNFQIYYKGMLTLDDGVYDIYGSDHHYYYHMSTTAHNGILVYNPALKSSSKSFYNGGQKRDLGVPYDYEEWLASDRFLFGKRIGVQYDSEKSPSYVYFANDLTLAYDTSTVDYMERSFMTVYTGDSKVPMILFVYDNIQADSATFQKTFLLQCAKAPTISGNTVTIDNGQGKLVLTSLKGADTIKAYGRTSKNGVPTGGNGSERFWLSGPGVNLPSKGNVNGQNNDNNALWGHVEIQPKTGNKIDRLMNVLYVTDSGYTVSTKPALIESADVLGAAFLGKVAVFVNDPSKAASVISFTSVGNSNMTYYVGGLNEGTWNVKIGSTDLGDMTVTRDGHMLTFAGAVGTVTLTPKGDVRPAGSELIEYKLDGGTLPSDAPTFFIKGQTPALPSPIKTGFVFDGWFTDAALTQPIRKIAQDASDTVTVYAKWVKAIVEADYTQGGAITDYPQLSYNKGEASATTYTMEGVAGRAYLLWKSSAASPQILKSGAYQSVVNDNYAVSFSLEVGKSANALQETLLYIRNTSGSSKQDMHLMYVHTDGTVTLGSKTSQKTIATLGTNTMTSLRLVLDFAGEHLIAYNANGTVIEAMPLSDVYALPAGFASYRAWFDSFTQDGYLLTLSARSAGELRIGHITVCAGNVFASCRHLPISDTEHAWDDGKIISTASSTSCAPGIMRYTCTRCMATKDTNVPARQQHTLTSEYDKTTGKLTYSCTVCHTALTLDTAYFLDGTDYKGMTGVDNSKYNDVSGAQPPIKNGRYELLATSDTTSGTVQGQMWFPKNNTEMKGFSADTNAVGFFSMTFTSSFTSGFSLKATDESANSGSDRWSERGCFNILSCTAPNGDKITLKDANNQTIGTYAAADIKLIIGMKIDKASDKLILYYFVNGALAKTSSRSMTISTNAITSFYLTGNTNKAGTGIIVDDIGLGFSAGGTLPIN